MDRFKSIKSVSSIDYSAAGSSSKLAPTHKKDAMVGFGDYLLEIKGQLCGESLKRHVIPIVGMGGIGKTTLARNAYDDPLIVHHFHIRSWITISQDYSAQKVLSNLLVSINPERSGQNNGSLADNVYKSLKGKRYLIVLDDMWSTEVWDDLNKILPDDSNGSRIMLTTRLSDVAVHPDRSSSLHEMRFMDADQSWNLLQQKVFYDEDCLPELEDIGKKIAGSCSGLPLAIVVVAGLLSAVSKTPASWEEIAENVNSAIATKDGQFEKILSLSYTHLPHHLRPYFLYFGAFPEDYEIYVSKLIKLWVAEGFVQSNDSKTLEETAEECLEDLVKRSLVLVAKRKSNGKIKSCSIHDLLRDLCIRKAKEEKFLHLVDNFVGKILPESIRNQRRIGIARSNLCCFDGIYGSSIRTILCFKHSGYTLLLLCANLRLLRLLHIVDDALYEIPDNLFELFHLRYLSIYFSSNRYLSLFMSSAISNLQNLQTIIIHIRKTERGYPTYSVILPFEIWRIPQLRHLFCFFLCFNELPDPKGASFILENLQTLSVATNFVCTKQILKMIPNLKKLGIFYYWHGDCLDYQLNNLVYLEQLEKLKLVVHADFPWRTIMLKPVFPETLKKLTLSRLQLPWEDMTIIGSFPNLQVLKLRSFGCKGYRWETSKGEFPVLKYLLIDYSDLQFWITESSHFPSLECLVLHRCWCLTEIPDGIGEIPTLELIEVDEENDLLVKSAKDLQEAQQDYGNDVLQVRFKTRPASHQMR